MPELPDNYSDLPETEKQLYISNNFPTDAMREALKQERDFSYALRKFASKVFEGQLKGDPPRDKSKPSLTREEIVKHIVRLYEETVVYAPVIYEVEKPHVDKFLAYVSELSERERERPINSLLLSFFGIDEMKLEKERRAIILDELRLNKRRRSIASA